MCTYAQVFLLVPTGLAPLFFKSVPFRPAVLFFHANAAAGVLVETRFVGRYCFVYLS